MTTTKRRVNPDVGVPLKTLRCALLGLVALAASAYAGRYVHEVVTMDTAQSRRQWCARASPTDPSPPYRTEQVRCWAETMAHPLAVTIAGGVVVTVVSALLICALAPRLRRLTARLRPAARELDRLSRLAMATWWSLLLTVALPYGVAALTSGYALSATVPLLKLLVVVVLARLWCRSLLRSRAGLSPEQAEVTEVSRLDLAALAATGAFAVPALSLWLAQVGYGMPVAAVAAPLAAWLGGAGLGAGLWALSWRPAVARRVTGRPVRPVLGGAVAASAGYFVGVLLTPVPREGGGLVEVHSSAQWVSFAVVSVAGTALILRLNRALAERLVARVRTPRSRTLLNGAGVVAAALGTALVLDGIRTFVFLARPEMGVIDVGWLAAVRFVIMPATWVVAVAAATTGIVALRRPPVPPAETPAWMLPAAAGPTDRDVRPADAAPSELTPRLRPEA